MADAGGYESKATEIVRRFEKLRAERSTLDSQLQEIAELIAPFRAEFTMKRVFGEKVGRNVFDSTAGVAADNLASGLYGMISSPTNDWFELTHEDDDIAEDGEVKLWLSICAKRMRNAFNANGARFYSEVFDCYSDIVAFGTSPFWCEEVPEQAAFYYSTRSLAECYVVENEFGQVDTVYRKFPFSARAAKRYFSRTGDQLPETIEKALEKEPDKEFDFIHAVYPNEEYMPNRLGPRGKKFASCWVLIESKALVRESGFDRFGYMVPRWKRGKKGYGESQAMLALADIHMLNTMSKTGLVGSQMVVRPPILAADERAKPGVRVDPGKMIYGGLDEMGNPRYKPLLTGARPDIGIEFENARREMIRDAFFATLMLMVSQPNETATAFLGKQDEKLRLLGPRLGKIQSEFLDPCIHWHFATMNARGAFPPPPDILRQMPGLRIRYTSPLARAQKNTEGGAILRWWGGIEPIAQLRPDILDGVDVDDISVKLQEAFGAPPSIILDPKKRDQKRAEAAQQAQQDKMAAMALPASTAAKNIAAAGQMASEQ